MEVLLELLLVLCPQTTIIPFTVNFTGSATVQESTYDVDLKVEGTQRPVASGVYTDTLTFTIMDDN